MIIAVVGAHLSGLPLNSQLTERGGKLLREANTAACYRLFALPNTTPPKPGLMRTNEIIPRGIKLELWELTPAAFGDFVGIVPPPMCIGSLLLESGEWVKGFLAEPIALEGATDITHHGGWRKYLDSLKA
ncbi:MAG: Allophanate hydrolase [Phycisphaerales bacterium]|nr:Allophanate hydrolase [Phycisphaerales bacterium]